MARETRLAEMKMRRSLLAEIHIDYVACNTFAIRGLSLKKQGWLLYTAGETKYLRIDIKERVSSWSNISFTRKFQENFFSDLTACLCSSTVFTSGVQNLFEIANGERVMHV